MARNFFTGGLMPSFDLPEHFQGHLLLEEAWPVNGQHYAKTCEDWLRNLDQNKRQMLGALAKSGHPDAPARQWQRWRMFVMACQELFAYRGGEHWFVGHFRMAPASA